MSRRKIHKDDPLDLPDGLFFKRSLRLFNELVDKTVAQKREQRLGLPVKDSGKEILHLMYCSLIYVFTFLLAPFWMAKEGKMQLQTGEWWQIKYNYPAQCLSCKSRVPPIEH